MVLFQVNDLKSPSVQIVRAAFDDEKPRPEYLVAPAYRAFGQARTPHVFELFGNPHPILGEYNVQTSRAIVGVVEKLIPPLR